MSADQSAHRHSLRQQGPPPVPETEDDSHERSEGFESEEFQSGQPRGTALTDDEVFEQSSASLSEVIVLLNRVTKRLDGLDARLDKVEVSAQQQPGSDLPQRPPRQGAADPWEQEDTLAPVPAQRRSNQVPSGTRFCRPRPLPSPHP